MHVSDMTAAAAASICGSIDHIDAVGETGSHPYAELVRAGVGVEAADDVRLVVSELASTFEHGHTPTVEVRGAAQSHAVWVMLAHRSDQCQVLTVPHRSRVVSGLPVSTARSPPTVRRRPVTPPGGGAASRPADEIFEMRCRAPV